MAEPTADAQPLPEEEQVLLDNFLREHFGDTPPDALSAEEDEIVEEVMAQVRERISELTFVLGLAIDFAIVAQELAEQDPPINELDLTATYDSILQRYELKPSRDGGDPNTLSLRYDRTRSNAYRGIRGIENKVVDLFHELNRTGYPSAAPHNTGQWRRFPELISASFKLSRSGRCVLVRRLLTFGAHYLERNIFFGPKPRVWLFDRIISDYPRRGPNENAGLTFQAIAYGFFSADRPHLDLVVDKVRTGSARQKRFGDVDCYSGLEPALSVEVKDGPLGIDEFLPQFGRFVRNVEASGVFAIAFMDEATEELVAKLDERKIVVMRTPDILGVVATWDWQKQDTAVAAMLHYLSHVEQNSTAVKRLLDFIQQHDSAHDALRFLAEPDPE